MTRPSRGRVQIDVPTPLISALVATRAGCVRFMERPSAAVWLRLRDGRYLDLREIPMEYYRARAKNLAEVDR